MTTDQLKERIKIQKAGRGSYEGLTMTPEEYIEKLKEAQRTLDSVKEDLDKAIDRMQRRIEVGYESMEQGSRLAALAGLEYIKLADSSIYEAATAKIEY